MAAVTTAEGLSIAYDETGEGPPLVLVHGITESAEMWAPLVPDLAADHRVVAVDLRGHGRSSRAEPYDIVSFASDVHQVLDSLGIGPEAVLVGHSLGGVVVTAYAAFSRAAGWSTSTSRSTSAASRPACRCWRRCCAATRSRSARPLGSCTTRCAGRSPRRAAGPPRRDPPSRAGRRARHLGAGDRPAARRSRRPRAIARSTPVQAPYLAIHGMDPGEAYEAWLRELIPSSSYEAVA